MQTISPENQKQFLAAAKKTLSGTHGPLTWDEFAKLAKIDPRAFKTYRMPLRSADFRPLPALAEDAILRLLEEAASPRTPIGETPALSLVVPALADLVVRQARQALLEDRLICGISLTPGSLVGLSAADRQAMSLVSRACLVRGLPDAAAEIHALLFSCTRPLGEWLAIPEVVEVGLAGTRLVHPGEKVPTVEAEELASRFSGLAIGLEEQMFARLTEQLKRLPNEAAFTYYTRVREFVVRHPICQTHALRALDIPSAVWNIIQQECYEPIPSGWTEANGQVSLCEHCGNILRPGAFGPVCRTEACALSLPTRPGPLVPVENLLRVTRGVQRFWVEPGFDEVRLFDRFVTAGMPALLYPERDLVDISVGRIGIDLKAYASPETLGMRLAERLGGLVQYEVRVLSIPDRLIQATPAYLDRLRRALGRSDVRCLSVSDTFEFVRAGVTARA